MLKYTADFETATWLENETYVWAWAVSEIGTNEVTIGNTIESFMEFVEKHKTTYYFHNLKFDSEFIISYLLNNGYEHVEDKKDLTEKTFTSLISDTGVFYNVEVCFRRNKGKAVKVKFVDSLKIIPFSVDETAKAFGLDISKLKIDYNEPRERGHILTKEEEDYIKNDVVIMSKALKMTFDKGLTKDTRASNALKSYKETIPRSRYNMYFPHLDLELDKEIRKAYKGGFTYCNDKWANKEVYNVVNLDVNSLYPSVMMYNKIPYGEPIFYEGEYEKDDIYDLYIQKITCSFEIKENKIPCVQIKKNMLFSENEYLKTSNNEIVDLVLTSVDLDLFKEQYNVHDLKYIYGWKFKSLASYMFKDYIEKWNKEKMQATIEKRKGDRQLAKLMLNSLYGKLATQGEARNKVPYLDEEGIVRYRNTDKKEKETIYIPAGCFITAWARNKTIRTSQAITDYSIEKYGIDLYYYSDTDSIKCGLTPEELKSFCDIDDVKLGAWKNEGVADMGLFVRQKTYLEMFGEDINITCAGLPKKCLIKDTETNKLYFKNIYGNTEEFTTKKFKVGFTCGGKLIFRHVKGGVILKEEYFTLKE